MKDREITRGIGRRVGWPHTAIRLPPPLRQPVKLESPAELRDLMRADIRQLRADNQRLSPSLPLSVPCPVRCCLRDGVRKRSWSERPNDPHG